MKTTFILDPGHGMGNRKAGVYDPGAASSGAEEASIVMDWVNEIRGLLIEAGHNVVRTRVDRKDPAPVGERASIAKKYKGEIMVSLHTNAATGSATGVETFYRGEKNAPMARRLNSAVVQALGLRDRGIKTESASQHSRLAVMEFQPTFLIELGFIDNPEDRSRLLSEEYRKAGVKAIAGVLLSWADEK